SDTALAAYLVRPGQRTFNLPDLVVRYLQRELRLDSDSQDGQLSLLEDEAEASRKAAEAELVKARAVAELADALDAELERIDSRQLLTDLELPLLFVLSEMEAAGIAVDAERLDELGARFAARVKQAEQDAFAVIGKEINLGSPKQLQVV
ncbi:hypothetical protein LH612_33930, partial [Klebsiella pneumoniae]|nr:hypothetical protein [Klebsiella pneumoniae]